MRYLLTGKQAKAVDAYSMEKMKIPSMVLMERAALAVAQSIQERTDDSEPVLAVCGMGNNGADGVAAARIFGAIASRLFSWEICRRPAENWQHRWKSPGIWEYRFLWGSRMNCLYPVQR